MSRITPEEMVINNNLKEKLKSKRKNPEISIDIPSMNTSSSLNKNGPNSTNQPGSRPPVKNSYLRVALLCKSGNLEKV